MIRRNRHDEEFNHDVWNFLPEKFTMVYSELCRKALSAPGSSLKGQERVSGRGSAPSPLGDDLALQAKRSIDRVLRKMAREYETGRRQPRPKCSGCGKYVQPEWNFCAGCGRGLTDTTERATWKGLPLR